MATASIYRLAHQTRAVLDEAEQQGRVIVTRDGLPVAALVPVTFKEAEEYMVGLLDRRDGRKG